MKKNKYYRKIPIRNINDSKRLPMIFLLDNSSSMQNNNGLIEFNQILNKFIKIINNDIRLRESCEIALLTVNSEVEIVHDFSAVENLNFKKNVIKKSEINLMGEAINKSLSLLKRRFEMYKNGGISYYVPYFIIISDGYFNFENNDIKIKVLKIIKNGHKSINFVLTIPIGVGKEINKKIFKNYQMVFLIMFLFLMKT